MTERNDSLVPREDPQDEAIDLILGEARDAAAMRARLVDPLEALEVAETRDLIERFREIGAEQQASASLRLRLAAAAAQRRRVSRHREPARAAVSPFVFWGAAAAVAMTAVGVISMLENGFVPTHERFVVDRDVTELRRPSAPVELVPDVDAASAVHVHRDERSGEVIYAEWGEPEPGLPAAFPVPEDQDPQFHEIMARWGDRPEPSEFDQWVTADNNLAVLRQEFRNRFTPTARKRALALTGANPDLDLRIQALAATVAERVDLALVGSGAEDVVEASVSDVALALRALLAAGSDPRLGDHRNVVRRCAAWMEARIREYRDGQPALDDAEMAVALAAMTDVAICSGKYGDLVREHAERLALRTVQGEEGARPGLLQWITRPLALGDAGRLFRLAPAFGVRTSVVFRARMLVAAHLEERLAADEDDPALLSAQRYGFEDLVDRDAIDQKLRVWRASFLRPDYVAMHHLAWSQYPVRPGWARFQRELRGLAALETPAGIGDPAALLLCLAMNFAAPGVSELVGAKGL